MKLWPWISRHEIALTEENKWLTSEAERLRREVQDLTNKHFFNAATLNTEFVKRFVDESESRKPRKMKGKEKP